MAPDASTSMQNLAKRRSWRGPIIACVTLGCGLLIAVTGVVSRERTFAQLEATAVQRSIPVVSVATADTHKGVVTLELPGRLEAYSRAALFARVSGYVARWKADIGSAVKAGDVLAEIEAPDLDQQLFQSQSDLANAQANEQLAEVTNQRYQALLPNSTVSRQTADEKASDLLAKQALVRSSQANVARLKALSEYKKVVAPFDGVVTARNTDVGALINAGSSSGTELFVVSDTRKLRLYINVPQSNVPAIKAGGAARITVPEHPGKFYAARVETGSGAVDAGSGTMRTQLVVDNLERELTPGSFASVQLDMSGAGDRLSVPASAIIFDKTGLRIATVDENSRIAFKKITVSRDLGNSVEIASGLSPRDRVVQSPPDDLLDGDRVTVLGGTPAPGTARLEKRNEKG